MVYKQDSIRELPKLPLGNLERVFNVYKDKDNKYFYNILNSIIFPKSLPLNSFDTYRIVEGDSWPLISHKHYNTINVWWAILLANDIINPVDFPPVGTIILIPKSEILKRILAQL